MSRVVIGIIAIPFIIYISLYQKIVLLAFASALSLLGAFELTGLLSGLKTRPIKSLFPAASAALTFLISKGMIAESAGVFFIAIALIAIASAFKNDSPILKGAVTDSVFGLIYCGILFSSIPLVAYFEPNGGRWLVALFIIIWCSDTAAYFGGKATGKRKLASGISPGKTVAGLWWGFGGALVASVILGLTIIPEAEMVFLLPLSIILSGIGVIGDLFESALKRSASVKDSSSIIPGHGGILDRFDSLLFAAPTLYFFLMLRDLMSHH